MAPLGYFLHSAGPAAHPVLRLGWVYAGICVAVCLLVAFLLAIAIFRRRPRESAAAIRHGAGGLGWVYAGTILSSCVLFAMAG
jgi:cytochrome c oxidase subunit 2